MSFLAGFFVDTSLWWSLIVGWKQWTNAALRRVAGYELPDQIPPELADICAACDYLPQVSLATGPAEPPAP